MENVLTLGEKIKSLRMSHGLSQAELADELHVSRYVISKWENNKSEPDITSLKIISQCFQISIDELLDNVLDSVLSTDLDSTSSDTTPASVSPEFQNYFVPCILFICLVVSSNVCWAGLPVSLYCIFYFYRHKHIRFYKLFILISVGFLTFNGYNMHSIISYHYATDITTIEIIDE